MSHKTEASPKVVPSNSNKDGYVHYFDVTNLVNFLSANQHVTGIQRLQMEAVIVPYFEVSERKHFSCCFFGDDKKWHSVDYEKFVEALLNENGSTSFKMKVFTDFLEKFESNPLIQWNKGDSIFLLGATWGLSGFFESMRDLKETGVACITYLHDILPISHPEFFKESHENLFSYWLSNSLVISDAFVCNSEETLASLKKYTDYDSVARVVDLNIKPNFVNIDEDEEEIHSALKEKGVASKDYILAVGTIEPRKNYVALINAWSKFQKERPNECPYLVIVGKQGWLSEPVELHLENSNRSGKIIWLQNVTDLELEGLYKECRHTVFLSRQEGWALPVTESLAMGKVCLVGEGSCAEAAGQGLVVKVDEESERDIKQSLIKLSTEKGLLKKLEGDLVKKAKFKNWETFLKDVRKVSLELNGNIKPIKQEIEYGNRYSFGRGSLAPLKGCIAIGEHFRRGSSWYSPDQWGNSVSEKSSTVSFGIPKSGELVCHLLVRCIPGGTGQELLANGKVIWNEDFKGIRMIVAEIGKIEQADGLTLELKSDLLHSTKNKVMGCSWLEMEIFEKKDLKKRLKSLERLVSMS